VIACFDIGGSAIKAARASSAAEIERTGTSATPLHDFPDFVAALRDLLSDPAMPPDGPIAISITGVVDPANGIIKCANIPCIDGRPLAADLSQHLGRPVIIANDADCFALAEARHGAGKGKRIVFGAILGTGVGGGLVINGHLVEGAGGFAGEWGHGPVAATVAGTPPVAIPGFPCGCGQVGCIDTIGGARGIERLHAHLHGQTLSSRDIIAAWEDGDAKAARTIDIFIDLVASPLALVVNIVGADIVPVGGGLSNSTALIARLDEAVRRRILRRIDQPLVVPAQCRIEPGLIGAASLALEEQHARA
jgi:N-acetylglucosamine kinase